MRTPISPSYTPDASSLGCTMLCWLWSVSEPSRVAALAGFEGLCYSVCACAAIDESVSEVPMEVTSGVSCSVEASRLYSGLHTCTF